MAKVSIIIPNYDGDRYIRECLDAVFAQDYESFEVIVVDNGSMDESIDIIKDEYPQVRLVMLPENKGFGYAVNHGIKEAIGIYVAVLHNDAIVQKDWLGNLVRAISVNDRIFSVASLVYAKRPDEPIDSAGVGYTLGGLPIALHRGVQGRMFKKNSRVFAAYACAALYRKHTFNQIGGFDENFFFSLEDVDIGWRAMLFGYKNIFCPDAKVVHYGSGTLGSKYNDFYARLNTRNNIYMRYKNMPPRQKALHGIFLPAAGGFRHRVFAKEKLLKHYLFGLDEGRRSRGKCRKEFFRRGIFRTMGIGFMMLGFTFKTLLKSKELL